MIRVILGIVTLVASIGWAGLVVLAYGMASNPQSPSLGEFMPSAILLIVAAGFFWLPDRLW